MTDEEIHEKHRQAEEAKIRAKKGSAWNHFKRAHGVRYESCRFDNFEVADGNQRQAVDKLKSFCESDDFTSSNLILLGPTGTGKDHLAVACVYEAIKREATKAEWVSGPQLFSKLRSAMSSNDAEDSIVSPYVNAQLLVVSDLAMTTLTDYQREIVYQIIDQRYNNCRATWVTANVATTDDFIAATSKQIWERLKHGAMYVPCNWGSFRKAQ